MVFYQTHLFAQLLTIFLICNTAYGAPPRNDVNCNIFSDDPSSELSMRCIKETSNPTPINGETIGLYHWAHKWDPSTANLATLQYMGTTVPENVLPLYSTFCDPIDITMILVPAMALKDAGFWGVQTQSPDGSQCYIRILKPTPTFGSPRMLNLIAHELYHCVESRNKPTEVTEEDWTKWWIEGGATYFANFFYPSSVLAFDDDWIHDYDLTSPLFSQLWTAADGSLSNGYPAGLFFLSLSNSNWDNDRINSWITNHHETADVAAERTSLSNDPDFPIEFVLFAQRFIDKALVFSDNTIVATTKELTTELISTDFSGGSTISEPWSNMPSFTANYYSATFTELGDVIKLTLNSQDTSAVLSYREKGTSPWTTLAAGASQQIQTLCGGNPVEYEFILTTTTPQDTSTGTIQFDLIPSGANRKRQNGQTCSVPPVNGTTPEGNSTGCANLGIPLDSCLIGNWVLDDATLQATIQKAEQSVEPGTTVSVTGTSTFDVIAPNQNVVTFDSTDISMNVPIALLGSTITTDTLVDGTIKATIALQKPGTFCWINAQADGQSSTTFDGGDPLVLGFGDVYALPGLMIDYTCDATTLSLSGYAANGTLQWQYVYSK